MVVDVGRQGLSELIQQGGLEDGVKIDKMGVAEDDVGESGRDWVWIVRWRLI